jgi:hypothetical protein
MQDLLEKNIPLLLIILSFIQLAVHQPPTTSISDNSRLQSLDEVMTRRILISPAKSKHSD